MYTQEIFVFSEPPPPAHGLNTSKHSCFLMLSTHVIFRANVAHSQAPGKWNILYIICSYIYNLYIYIYCANINVYAYKTPATSKRANAGNGNIMPVGYCDMVAAPCSL